MTTHFCNRNIADEAHERIGALADNGIRSFAFTTTGGWVVVSGTNEVFARNIPDECHTQLETYVAKGEQILSVAFVPGHANGWSIITEGGVFNRNVPDECHERMNAIVAKGQALRCVAFPPAGGNRWVIVSDRDFYARNIPDECYQILRNIEQGARAIHLVAFDSDGGWVILAADYFFARDIPGRAFKQLKQYRRDGRQVDIVAFDPDRRGWSMISNHRASAAPVDLPRSFEARINGNSIWDEMRDQKVPGAAVAVVVNNRLAWACGYGHVALGSTEAVHPETLAR